MSEREQAQRAVFGEVFWLAQSWKNLLDALLQPEGLSAKQWMLLVCVESFAPQAPTLGQAAERYGASHQAAKQLALRLQRHGFLCLEPDTKDRRSLRLHLTEHHHDFWRRHAAAHHERFTGLFATLGTEQLQQTSATLDALLARSRHIESALYPTTRQQTPATTDLPGRLHR